MSASISFHAKSKVCSLFLMIILILVFWGSPGVNAFAQIIVDNDGPGTSSTGSWKASGGQDYYGTQSVYSRDPGATYIFTANLNGNHNVSMWWTWYSSRCSTVPVEIYDGNTLLNSVEVNQQDQAQASTWYDLGNYNFSGTARVVVLSQSSGCSTCADAVSFVAGEAPDLDRIEIEAVPRWPRRSRVRR